MAVQAYVLIEVDGANAKSVHEKIVKIPGIKSASPVTGPFDIIAVVEGSGLAEIGITVANKIRSIDGVNKTITCVSVLL